MTEKIKEKETGLVFEYEIRNEFLNLYRRKNLHSGIGREEGIILAQDILEFLVQVPFKDGLTSSLSEAVKKQFSRTNFIGFKDGHEYIANDIHSGTRTRGVYILLKK